MVTITCDNCGAESRPNIERANAEWIQGYDIMMESPRMVQRAVRLLDRWDDRRIAEFGAVHFCSVECKKRYMNRRRAA